MPEVTKGPRGRLDVLAVRLAEHVTKRHLEPRIGVPLWDNGLGEIVETAVEESSIPKRPVTAVDLARAAGILKRKGKRVRSHDVR